MPSETQLFEWVVPAELSGERLDVCLAKLQEEFSRTAVQPLIREGHVMLNSQVSTLPRTKVSANDSIRLEAPPPEVIERAQAEHIPLNVLYEDEEILVIDKSAGMVVHPGAGNWTGTIVNAVLGRAPELLDDADLDPLRPGIVHRLDKDTSGCLVIAKTPKSLRKLSRSFADRDVEKVYAAIVFGWPLPAVANIRTLIGRHPVDRKKMAVLSNDGREASTSYNVVKQGYWQGCKVALLKVKLFTGRTHQIRVHMSHAGYPLVGEKLYNRGRCSPAERQMLHAWRLCFPHPATQEFMEFESPFPEDFREILDHMTVEKQ